jgi:LuxR family quorum sensing-dependent transcriptional regulator
MNTPLNNTTLDTVQALDRAPSILKVKEVFRSAVEHYGYISFLCTAAPQPFENVLDAIIFDAWPRDWLERYTERRYHLRDPMVGEMCRTAQPFTWVEALERGRYSKSEISVVQEASAWGMHLGFVVPIYGVGGEAHALTMAGPSPRSDSLARAELHLLSIYAHARANRLKRGGVEPPVSLRRRECEVLQWAAAGKSDWEIGQILGISESAAHKHVESAKRKFGVPTRMQAVVAAIRRGDLHL